MKRVKSHALKAQKNEHKNGQKSLGYMQMWYVQDI